jgi:hypothetical protein
MLSDSSPNQEDSEMDLVNPDVPSIEPVIGTLRVASGARLEDATPYVAALTTPPRAARGREDEHLFVLLDLTGLASSHLCRELREIVVQTYWSNAGSITSALRRAATAVNRHLFQMNLRSDSSERCYGGLTCAVLHGDDLFILQAGPGHACVLQGDRLVCFPRDEGLAHLGIGPLADTRLYHVFATASDMLLLASPTLVREGGYDGIVRVLPRPGVQEVLEGLEQIGIGADFSALVVRWTLTGKEPVREEEPVVVETSPPPLSTLPEVATISVEPRKTPEPPEPRRGVGEDLQATPVEWVRQDVQPLEPTREPGPGLGERMKGGVSSLGRGLTFVGRGVAATGTGLAEGASTLFQRMLPGAEREARPQEPRRRPIPDENRALMVALVIGIPILVVIIVALADLQFGTEGRARTFIKKAEEEIALAQAAGDNSAEARPHWEVALEHIEEAAKLQPGNVKAAELQIKIEEAEGRLDSLDGIVRLAPIQLWDFGAGTIPRKMVVHGQMIFVLDLAGGWGVRLTLNSTGDGVVEEDVATLLVRTGQQVGEGMVGSMVDLVWVAQADERRTSALLILEKDGALLNYDPAWMDEAGNPRLKRSFLDTPPTGTPKAVGSFEGRFYVLDTLADESGQLWRYQPLDDAYPEQPERYFADPPPKPLAGALDMAIDGNVYILYDDGTILKFLGGELEDFDVRGLPGDLSRAVTFAVDADGSSGEIYVADKGNERVAVLESDGTFRAQFRAEGAFDDLEALTVDEADKRLYVLSGGRLYVASLP